MPSDDYIPVIRGGLKLKGGGGVTKPKAKKSMSQRDKQGKDGSGVHKQDADRLLATATALRADEVAEKRAVDGEDGRKSAVKGDGTDGEDVEPGESGHVDDQRRAEDDGGTAKTANERAYEEMRRKRLKERLEKEGVKTHKERVEGLNRYLSTLSEHHDLPRIGPG